MKDDKSTENYLFVRLKEILVEIYNDEREEQIEKLEIKQRFLQIEF